MAYYISIRKSVEDAFSVEYIFGDPEGIDGKLLLDKSTGAIKLLQTAPNDSEQHLFQRAARKIWLHWNAGEFPERTCWAS